MKELVRENNILERFCSIVFIDSEINQDTVYTDIRNKFGGLVVLEKQDNWCFLEDTIYAVDIKEFDHDDLHNLFNSITNKKIKIFLICSVDIQKGIHFSVARNLLEYLLIRSFRMINRRSSIFPIVYMSSFIYLLTTNYFIANGTQVTENKYIPLKSSTELIVVDYTKYKKDSNNFYTRSIGIKYEYFNSNPKGLEYIARNIATNDCLIRALCLMTGEFYRHIYENLCAISASNYTMTNKITNAVLYLNRFGIYKFYRVKKCITVGELIKKYPQYGMLISNGDHIVYKCNNVVYDNNIYRTDQFILSKVKYIIIESCPETNTTIDSEMFSEISVDDF